MRRIISLFVILAFLTNGLMPQTLRAQEIILPKPGVMVHLSLEFTPALLKGIVVHPENAFKFDFIIYKGDKGFTESQKKHEYTKLIKYFLASLAVPDEDQWVNLSPYEKGRIIKEDFGKTEMGRDLLAQDYLLKQITASLIYPQDKLGRKFWNEIYEQAYKQYGTTDIPVNTFNKVWIVPDEADIYEKGNVAYLYKSHLKVMLEEDYEALNKNIESAESRGLTESSNDRGMATEKQLRKSLVKAQKTQVTRDGFKSSSIGAQVLREIVIPALETEVNEGKNFAPLRQVFSGMILAAWYKRALRESLLAKIYANKAKVRGVDQDPKNNEAIYRQYLKAYKKGVFNFIQEDVDKYTNDAMPRKYFSGGWAAPRWDNGVLRRHSEGDVSAAMATAAALKLDASQAGDDLTQVSVDPKQNPTTSVKNLSAAMTAASLLIPGFTPKQLNNGLINLKVALRWGLGSSNSDVKDGKCRFTLNYSGLDALLMEKVLNQGIKNKLSQLKVEVETNISHVGGDRISLNIQISAESEQKANTIKQKIKFDMLHELDLMMESIKQIQFLKREIVQTMEGSNSLQGHLTFKQEPYIKGEWDGYSFFLEKHQIITLDPKKVRVVDLTDGFQLEQSIPEFAQIHIEAGNKLSVSLSQNAGSLYFYPLTNPNGFAIATRENKRIDKPYDTLFRVYVTNDGRFVIQAGALNPVTQVLVNKGMEVESAIKLRPETISRSEIEKGGMSWGMIEKILGPMPQLAEIKGDTIDVSSDLARDMGDLLSRLNPDERIEIKSFLAYLHILNKWFMPSYDIAGPKPSPAMVTTIKLTRRQILLGGSLAAAFAALPRNSKGHQGSPEEDLNDYINYSSETLNFTGSTDPRIYLEGSTLSANKVMNILQEYQDSSNSGSELKALQEETREKLMNEMKQEGGPASHTSFEEFVLTDVARYLAQYNIVIFPALLGEEANGKRLEFFFWGIDRVNHIELNSKDIWAQDVWGNSKKIIGQVLLGKQIPINEHTKILGNPGFEALAKYGNIFYSSEVLLQNIRMFLTWDNLFGKISQISEDEYIAQYEEDELKCLSYSLIQVAHNYSEIPAEDIIQEWIDFSDNHESKHLSDKNKRPNLKPSEIRTAFEIDGYLAGMRTNYLAWGEILFKEVIRLSNKGLENDPSYQAVHYIIKKAVQHILKNPTDFQVLGIHGTKANEIKAQLYKIKDTQQLADALYAQHQREYGREFEEDTGSNSKILVGVAATTVAAGLAWKLWKGYRNRLQMIADEEQQLKNKGREKGSTKSVSNNKKASKGKRKDKAMNVSSLVRRPLGWLHLGGNKQQGLEEFSRYLDMARGGQVDIGPGASINLIQDYFGFSSQFSSLYKGFLREVKNAERAVGGLLTRRGIIRIGMDMLKRERFRQGVGEAVPITEPSAEEEINQFIKDFEEGRIRINNNLTAEGAKIVYGARTPQFAFFFRWQQHLVDRAIGLERIRDNVLHHPVKSLEGLEAFHDFVTLIGQNAIYPNLELSPEEIREKLGYDQSFIQYYEALQTLVERTGYRTNIEVWHLGDSLIRFYSNIKPTDPLEKKKDLVRRLFDFAMSNDGAMHRKKTSIGGVMVGDVTKIVSEVDKISFRIKNGPWDENEARIRELQNKNRPQANWMAYASAIAPGTVNVFYNGQNIYQTPINQIGPYNGMGLLRYLERNRINPRTQLSLKVSGHDILIQGPKIKDRAMKGEDNLGGIDMNAANLNMNIKRDGNGVPLPVSQQDLGNIHIDGLVPVILEIRPASASPILSQLTAPGQARVSV